MNDNFLKNIVINHVVSRSNTSCSTGQINTKFTQQYYNLTIKQPLSQLYMNVFVQSKT